MLYDQWCDNALGTWTIREYRSVYKLEVNYTLLCFGDRLI